MTGQGVCGAVIDVGDSIVHRACCCVVSVADPRWFGVGVVSVSDPRCFGVGVASVADPRWFGVGVSCSMICAWRLGVHRTVRNNHTKEPGTPIPNHFARFALPSASANL